MAADFKPCSVAACNGNSHYSAKGARGWCRRHYRLWQAHGEPVARKAANGEPLDYLTQAVFTYDGEECLIWPFAKVGGYGWVNNPDGTCLVHRLSCEHRHGPPPSSRHEAAHSCGNGHLGCVAPNHVRWALPAENQADRALHGTSNRGERCAQAKLTVEQVREIRSLKGKLPLKQVAARFGVGAPTISQINSGKTWAWLDT